jgi:hypothetical protein
MHISFFFISSTETNECDPNPCKNCGTCIDLVYDHKCKCDYGFYGDHCENGKESGFFYYGIKYGL